MWSNMVRGGQCRETQQGSCKHASMRSTAANRRRRQDGLAVNVQCVSMSAMCRLVFIIDKLYS